MTEEEKMKEGANNNLQQMYANYQKCKDTQHERFWQNSTFIWTFVFACFGAYGYLVSFWFDKDKISFVNSVKFQLLIIACCCLGFVLSWIWIWMVRGSKAWYEVYENAIWTIEKEVYNNPSEYVITNFFTLKFNEFNKCRRWRLFKSLPISPSKINILIGVLLIIVWGTLLLVHLLKFSKCIDNIVGLLNDNEWIIAILIVVVLLLIIWLTPKLFINSSELNHFKYLFVSYFNSIIDSNNKNTYSIITSLKKIDTSCIVFENRDQQEYHFKVEFENVDNQKFSDEIKKLINYIGYETTKVMCRDNIVKVTLK